MDPDEAAEKLKGDAEPAKPKAKAKKKDETKARGSNPVAPSRNVRMGN